MAAPIAAGMQENTAYLVQEYVPADSLDVVLRDQGPAPLVDALRVVRQLADAVDAGVAHGAIHPRDVLLSPHDVRVTGFGIVPALEQVGVAAPLRRPYTAPERLAGAAWDRRADMFSIAAVMYDVLVGKRITGTGEAGVAGLIDLEGVDCAALRAVFGRALAENPAERFESGSAFAEALVVASRQPSSRRQKPRAPERGEAERSKAVAATPEHAGDDGQPSPAQPDLPLQIDMAALRPLAPPRLAEQREPRPEPEPQKPIPVSVPSPDPHPSPPHGPPPRATVDAARASGAGARPDRGRVPFEPALQSVDLSVPAPVMLSALDRSRAAMWPLALAFVVGGGLGIAVGFALYPMMNAGPGGENAAPVVGSAVAAPIQSAAPVPMRTPPAASAPAAAGPPSSTPRRIAPAAPVVADTPPPHRSAPQRAAEPPRAPAPEDTGRVLVRSTPAGARVMVDGRDRGVSPAEVRDLPNGPHNIRIMLDGYMAAERRIVITSEDPAQNLTIPLTPISASAVGTVGDTGELRIESRPAGAAVYVDGRPVGTTPMVISAVAAGAHQVRMELDGYRPWTASATVTAGGDNRVTGSLER
jgi:hypothetical protein